MLSEQPNVLAAEVKGSTVWGGGFNQWTVFMLEVSLDGETWTVYRRYSAFEALHGAIIRCVDVMTRAYLTKNFPEKEMGSFLGTFNFVAGKRVQILKRYLSLLLMHPHLVNNAILLSFLDTEHCGASGVARSLGRAQIHLEGFVDMSLPDFANLMWSTCFLVLTQSGQLFALEDIYDGPEKAFLAADLRLGGRVMAKGAGKCEVITHGSAAKTFSIDFKDQRKLATWVRAMSSVMIQTDESSLRAEGEGEGEGADGRNSFIYSSSSARSSVRSAAPPSAQKVPRAIPEQYKTAPAPTQTKLPNSADAGFSNGVPQDQMATAVLAAAAATQTATTTSSSSAAIHEGIAAGPGSGKENAMFGF